jgi:hypothetical protein
MISSEQLAAVAAALSPAGDTSALRQQFPDLHFTFCSDDDVSPRFKPVLSTAGFQLYLITGASGHCLELTQDTQIATGVLVATQVDEE